LKDEQVKTAQPTDFLLLVNDVQGRLVERQEFSKTNALSASIDVRALLTEVYSLTLSTKDGMLTKQFVKQ
jgi:hypothetical protein